MSRLLSIALCVSTLSLGACSKSPTVTKEEGKTLVAYFSAQGHTKAAAEKVSSTLSLKATIRKGNVKVIRFTLKE